LIVSRKEPKILIGEMNDEEAIDKFKEIGCENVVLKHGKEGSVYDFNNKRNLVENPRQFTEIDPVRDGDAFASGILSGILRKELLNFFVEKACFLGGYITQFIGDYQGFPSEAMLTEVMKKDNGEKVKR